MLLPCQLWCFYNHIFLNAFKGYLAAQNGMKSVSEGDKGRSTNSVQIYRLVHVC